MKTTTLRTFRALHTWVGLISGFALFIAFYAGAITVFTEELHLWEQNEPLPHSSGAADIYSEIQTLIDKVLERHPAAANKFQIAMPNEHQPRPLLLWDERHNGQWQRHQFRLSEAGQLVTVEPRSELAHLIYKLHYTAGLPVSVGLYFMGLVCVVYGVALVSGIVIYAPGFLTDLFALRRGKNIKRLWQDAHNVIGVLSLPFHVIFAWSSAVLAIGTLLLAPFQFLVFDGKLLDIINRDLYLSRQLGPAGVAAAPLPVAELVARARAELPELRITTLRFRNLGDENAQVDIFGRIEDRSLSQRAGVAIDAATGTVTRTQASGNYSPGTTFLYGLQSLHFGDFAHTAVKWLYFLLGMIGAFLFYSGNLLWIEARRRRRSPLQPRQGFFVARLTLGVCLGCIAGISAVFLANKGLPLMLADRVLWEERVYYVVFLLCIVWAFLRPPARAGHELLIACALLTAAIPLANAWRTGDHMLRTLIEGQWVVFGVDAVALLFAWAYWRMAGATLRRGREGDSNSVWALEPNGRQARLQEPVVTDT